VATRVTFATLLQHPTSTTTSTPNFNNYFNNYFINSASQLMIEPYDRTALSAIEKGILESGVGLNPNNDGQVIRLNIPPVTEDRRWVLAAPIILL
jgi:ribosome recycling factor